MVSDIRRAAERKPRGPNASLLRTCRTQAPCPRIVLCQRETTRESRSVIGERSTAHLVYALRLCATRTGWTKSGSPRALSFSTSNLRFQLSLTNPLRQFLLLCHNPVPGSQQGGVVLGPVASGSRRDREPRPPDVLLARLHRHAQGRRAAAVDGDTDDPPGHTPRERGLGRHERRVRAPVPARSTRQPGLSNASELLP